MARKQPEYINLLDAIRPPRNMELEALVISTYSLNPLTFLGIVANASLAIDESMEACDFLDLEKSIQKEIVLGGLSKSVAFCDHHGNLNFDLDDPAQLKVADHVVKNIASIKNVRGSLHSKLLLAIYTNEDACVCGRLYVGSRNFQHSYMQEFGVVFHLEKNKNGNIEFTENMLHFLKDLRKNEGSKSAADKLKPLEQSIKFIEKHSLTIKNKNAQFHFQSRFSEGNKTPLQLMSVFEKEFHKKYRKIFIISPWVRPRQLEYFRKESSANVEIFVKCLNDPQFKQVFADKVFYDLTHSIDGRVPDLGSHEKVYLFWSSIRSKIYFGSANFTTRGLGTSGKGRMTELNTEILIEDMIDSKDFRYLMENAKSKPDKELLSPDTSDNQDKMEKIELVVLQIEVSLEWDRKSKKGIYVFDKPQQFDVDFEILVEHVLFEADIKFPNKKTTIYEGMYSKLPKEIELESNSIKIENYTSIIRMSIQGCSDCIDYLIDLDESILSSRSNLNVFRITNTDVIDRLARLMEINLGTQEKDKGLTKKNELEEKTALFLRKLRLESFAIRLSRLRKENCSEYMFSRSRLKKFLERIENDPNIKLESHNIDKVLSIIRKVLIGIDKT